VELLSVSRGGEDVDALNALLKGDQRGLARALGGVLFGIAILVIVIRRTSVIDPWGDFPVFFVVAVATVALLGTGLLGGRAAGGLPTGWQIVYSVFGLLLLPVALYTFLNWIGGDTNSTLNAAWIFALVALASFATAIFAGVRAGCLFGAIALLVVWLTLWNELLDAGIGADIGTLRGLLLVAELLLVGLAGLLAMRSRPEGGAGDVVTVAGIAAVAAGAISLGALSSGLVPTVAGAAPTTGSSVSTSTFWELELVVVSLALVLFGARGPTRGPVYVGGFGLFGFTYLVGLDAGNPSRDGSLLGWPLILLIAAFAALAIGLLPALRRRQD
jgi:hypothetical protein